MERRKYLGRYDKDFIKEITSSVVRTDEIGFSGYSSFIKILDVNYPYIVGDKGYEVCIGDKGYSELSFLPDNENWQMTAIYDNNDKIIEWYFDVTKKNAIDENGNPYCDDLYLDVALLPNGKILTFDEEQLEKALDDNIIRKNDYDMAYNVINMLKENGILTVGYMVCFYENYFHYFKMK